MRSEEQTLHFAVFQMNAVVGDVAGNAKRMIQASHDAKKMGADLLITPEMSLCGYSAEDLWFDPSFLARCDEALAEIAAQSVLPILIGHPALRDNVVFNAASVLYQGKTLITYHKQCLPNDSVFDEMRYFAEGETPGVFRLNEVSIGLLICEDLWLDEPLQATLAMGAEVVVVINASPFSQIKPQLRQLIARSANRPLKTSILYVNTVGGQDELVFDGGSFAINPCAEALETLETLPPPVWQLPRFVETLAMLSWQKAPGFIAANHAEVKDDPLANLYGALRLGLVDYLRKNHIERVYLGLSGGIDSAVTAAICAEALGAERVTAVMMPSVYSAAISREDAQTLAKNLNIAYLELPINPAYQALTNTLAASFAERKPDVTEENLQARIRGVLLMALANKFGGIVINTSNKSEMATGYGTLYGDMVGGFALLKDVYKGEVYRLAHHINRSQTIIPERIIRRAPSAELRPDQTDQDTLPPYDLLDFILAQHLESGVSQAEMLANVAHYGGNEAIIRHVFRLLHLNEYKRRQAPIGVRVSEKAFGKDRRMPITHRFVNPS